jgi:hypothetical protein
VTARRGASSAGTRARCRDIPIHNVKQRSLLRSRSALLRPGLLSSFPSTPMRGERSAERRSISVVARFGARRSALVEARRASSGTRSPLGAPPWRFWAGGRASFSGISSGSVQRCSSQPGRSARRAVSRTSRGRRLRAAAAGRHSPLRLRHVSGDGPSDERGWANTTTCALRSQPVNVA